MSLESVNHSVDDHRSSFCRARGLAWGLLFLALLENGAIAQQPQSPAPISDKIEKLIRDLEREYTPPQTTWGGAVQQENVLALQVVQERAERSASRAAQQELLKTGKAAVPQLIDALKTAEGRKAEAIAQILGSIGGRETLYPLLRLADDPNQVLRVRLAATMSAAKQGDQSQWPLLIAGLWLSGEWLLLSDALSGSKLVNNELDRHRLQWYREAQQETFSAVRSALHSLAPNASPASVPEEKIWETVIAWNKWWTKGRPFQAVEVLADDPWQNRFWCKRTLGTLAEYGPMVAEMRRLFIEARLSHYGERQNIPFARAVADLESMNYSVEPFAQGSKESVRFSLSGYVQSNMITYDYGYDRKTGAWVLLGRTFIGYDGLPQTKGKEQQK